MLNERLYELMSGIRGYVPETEVPTLFAGLALLKYSGRDLLKNLVLQSKEQLEETLAEITSRLDVSLLSSFTSEFKSIVDEIPDTTYRSLLTAANNLQANDLMKVATTYGIWHGGKDSFIAVPTEISKLLVGLADIQPGDSLLDPTAGVGGVLVETLHYQPGLIVGQETNVTVAQIGYLNLLVNGANEKQLKFYTNDVLLHPHYLNEFGKFDKIVQVVPFGFRLSSSLDNDEYGRFPFGPLSKMAGTLAYISNAISSLKPTGGKAVVLVSAGNLYRGGSEARIRKNILAYDLIETVISLPANMFYSTGIETAIIVLDNDKPSQSEKQVQFIKVNDEMTRSTRTNKQLKAEALEQILELYHSKKEVPGLAANIPVSEIKNGDLSVESYIKQVEFTVNGEEIHVNYKKLQLLDTLTLGRVAEIGRGYNFSSKDESDTGEYQVIRITDLTEMGIDYTKLISVNPRQVDLSSYLVQKGDILLSVRGNTNKVELIEEGHDKLLVHANLVSLRVRAGYDEHFLKLYLKSSLGQILLATLARGTTVKQISIQDLRLLPVPNLSLARQQEIVANYQRKMLQVEQKLAAIRREERDIQHNFYDATGMGEAFEIEEE
ncbi:N-6 DNA methylase [Ligilactobacillus agilis]|uniref:N-6 DNA methylase n=1 Tax=Ligilactobacillus agilis TaxID=1601 RepID=UPI0019560102|nr:N-6 DNA methylase [Ligilactobacillus agilis]MBM6772398.1 N-6 DNA methylase [Ligilactobacillus agilis]